MKTIARAISRWFVPQGVAELVHDWRKESARRRRISDEPVLAQNRRFKGLHTGKRCFIIASGPSIKGQDLTLLKNDISISVSNSFVHKDYSTIQPHYHCVPDISSGHSQYLAGREEKYTDWLRSMDASLGRAELFMSTGDRKWIESRGLFQKRPVNYILFDGEWGRVAQRGVDLTQIVAAGQSVSVMALQIAMYMGFKQIYLLGCDHDWLLHVGTSTHSYDSQTHAAFEGTKHSEWDHSSFGIEVRNSDTLWQQYECLKALAKQQSIEILNASGGVLDVFPRVKYESLFEEKIGRGDRI